MGLSEPRRAQLWSFEGAPTSGDNGTLHQHADVGDLYLDTSAGALYRCVALTAPEGATGPATEHLQGTPASITWSPLQA